MRALAARPSTPRRGYRELVGGPRRTLRHANAVGLLIRLDDPRGGLAEWSERPVDRDFGAANRRRLMQGSRSVLGASCRIVQMVAAGHGQTPAAAAERLAAGWRWIVRHLLQGSR